MNCFRWTFTIIFWPNVEYCFALNFISERVKFDFQLFSVVSKIMPQRTRRHLDQTTVIRAVQMIEDGHTQRYVSGRLQIPLGVVNRFWRRFQETGSYARRPGQGRKRKTTPHQDRYLAIRASRNRQSTARSLALDFHEATQITVSDQTVRNRLHEHGMRARRPAARPILIRRHRRDRLEFADEHLQWNRDQWNGVLFSDETKFNISNNDRRVRVWRRAGERYADCNIVEHDHYGGGSVMVWAGICLGGRTDLVVVGGGSITGQRYRDEVLQPIVLPFAGAVGEKFIFMHDNARAHVSRIAMGYLKEEGIECMGWPARSPDLNPIEHAWDILGRKIRERQPAPRDVQALELALREEWENTPQEALDNLILSMPRRLEECRRARGGHTSY